MQHRHRELLAAAAPGKEEVVQNAVATAQGVQEELQRQLEQFRGAQPPRTKLPPTLWDRAAELRERPR